MRRLAVTMASAFANYPWTRWMVDERDHEQRLRELYEIYLTVGIEFGEVWMVDDARGVAAWTWSPDAETAAAFMEERGYAERVADIAGAHAVRAEHAQALAERQLTEPHWYLAAVGVDPAQQNRGIGTRLLRPMLDRLDREGGTAALDTSSEANVRLYRRLGFTVRDELDMPDGGPHVWFMDRRPPG